MQAGGQAAPPAGDPKAKEEDSPAWVPAMAEPACRWRQAVFARTSNHRGTTESDAASRLRGARVMDPSAQDSYSKLFKPFLSDSHISAMAAIFGWSVGEGERVCSVAVL